MGIAIIGGGIGGLALALFLQQRGLDCEVYEAAPDIRRIGVGITLLPHGMRELAALGLQAELEAQGVEIRESLFFNRWGQFVYREPRGRPAGYPLPEIGVHRGMLHTLLYRAVVQRLGGGRLHLGHRCVGLEQDADAVRLRFEGAGGRPQPPVQADLAIACDGVHSGVRRHFYPREQPVPAGIHTWRGVSVHPPILGGRSYLRIGTLASGELLVYPIIDNVDGQGNQLVNWVAEVRRGGAGSTGWDQPGRADDLLPLFRDWKFDWLDVPALIAGATQVFESPMVDKDPVPRWTFGRVTFLGDAAHPMYPRGTNGSAQALIDARMLADELAAGGDPRAALARYEALRLDATARIVEANRTVPPDLILTKADELAGHQPFAGSIDDLVSQEELRRISQAYQEVAGFSVDAMRGGGP